MGRHGRWWSDGALELREAALSLKNQRDDLVVIRDFKHFAANVMKSLVGQTPRFEEFSAEVGRTRSAIQQTELAHVAPPRFKPKSRFMNLQASLRWAGVISWLLASPESESRKALETDRVEAKLGWLREYAEDLATWQECQTVIDLSCGFLNAHGLFPGVSACLQSLICESVSHSVNRVLADRLLTFVKESEALLRAGERLPISTEILESRFGFYKPLEGQHSKGGFTSLLPTMAVLGQVTTPEQVKAAFARVNNKDVKVWVKQQLGQTVTARRRSVNAEYKSATKQRTTT